MIATIADFLARTGVNTHVVAAGAGSPYASTAGTLADLKTLGVSAIRDRALPGEMNAYTQQKYGPMMAPNGPVKTLCGIWSVDSYGVSIADQLVTNKAWLKSYPSLNMLIEGKNEPQNFPLVNYDGKSDTQANGWAATQAFQQDLYLAVSMDAAFIDCPVVGPSWFPAPQGVRSPCNFVNVHAYATQAQGISPNLNGQLASVQGGYDYVMPWVMTEGGYCGIPGVIGGAGATDMATAAKLNLCLIAQAYRSGAEYVFLYTLYDDVPTNNLWGASFGLFSATGVIRPTGQALANLMAILGGAEPVLAPSPQTFTAPAGAFTLPLVRAEGVWDILIWNEAEPNLPPPTPIVLELPFTASTVSIFDPVNHTAPTAIIPGAQAVPLTLSGSVQIVRVTA